MSGTEEHSEIDKNFVGILRCISMERSYQNIRVYIAVFTTPLGNK